MISKGLNQNQKKLINNNFTTNIMLLFNNIYLFYLIFIPMNRIDLLLISFASIELLLLSKRMIFFWVNEP